MGRFFKFLLSHGQVKKCFGNGRKLREKVRIVLKFDKKRSMLEWDIKTANKRKWVLLVYNDAEKNNAEPLIRKIKTHGAVDIYSIDELRGDKLQFVFPKSTCFIATPVITFDLENGTLDIFTEASVDYLPFVDKMSFYWGKNSKSE